MVDQLYFRLRERKSPLENGLIILYDIEKNAFSSLTGDEIPDSAKLSAEGYEKVREVVVSDKYFLTPITRRKARALSDDAENWRGVQAMTGGGYAQVSSMGGKVFVGGLH